jgi:hypothetical protein
VSDGSSAAARARATVADLTNRLVQGRAVTLRAAGGAVVRAAAAPAILGRDPRAEVPLRDPGVSRRHAQLTITSEECVLADLGSRLGTFVGAARLERPWPLSAETEVSLGPSCRLRLQRNAPDFLIVRAEGGLDGGLLAIVGRERLPLGPVLPEAAGLWIEFDADGVHLVRRAPLIVRLGGKLASERIDLLHGDRIDIDGATSLEVA